MVNLIYIKKSERRFHSIRTFHAHLSIQLYELSFSSAVTPSLESLCQFTRSHGKNEHLYTRA